VTYKGIEPTYMPITGIATIALDEIIFSKQQAIERCLRYLSTDTVSRSPPPGFSSTPLSINQCYGLIPPPITTTTTTTTLSHGWMDGWQVCYFFPDTEDDRKLLRRQQKHWEPLLVWMKEEFGIEIARPSHMLDPCEHSEETYMKVAR